jgi:AraC-like DNA-binding protein
MSEFDTTSFVQNFIFFDMDAYRKYFNESQIKDLVDSEPNWGVNVVTVGHYVHDPLKPYPDPKHPASHYFSWEHGRRLKEFQMVYIANGKGIFETEHTPPIVVEEGTLFLLFPGVWHRYKPLEGTSWEEFWVGFSGHYSEYLMRQDCFDAKNSILSIGFNTEFLNIFIRLIDTVKYEGVAYTQISSCLVIQLLGLVYASALLSEKSKSRQEQVIRAIRYKIHQNWADNVDMEKLASEQNVSYVWFRKAFKDIMGTSPGQYHLNLKIEKAAQMLKETNLLVSEVAYKTGFESEFYFSRIFKKKMNVKPSDYRKGK